MKKAKGIKQKSGNPPQPDVLREALAEKRRLHKKIKNHNPKLVLKHLPQAIALYLLPAVKVINRAPKIVLDEKKHKDGGDHQKGEISFVGGAFGNGDFDSVKPF